jgi:hypothetical protein
LTRRSLHDLVSSVPMPAATASECVRVLVSLGWMPTSWTERECLLIRGPFSIVIPLKPQLDSAEVGAIVQQAVISPIAFVDGLEKIRTAHLTTYADSFDPTRKAAG